MLDFFTISTRSPKKGIVEVYPIFNVGSRKDLMIRGRDFYAVWDEDNKLWSTDENTVIRIIDDEVAKTVNEQKTTTDGYVKGLYMKDSSSGIIDIWHKYVQKQQRDNFHPLDEKITFLNDEPKQTDYVSKKLKYPIEEIETPAYDELMDVLYSPEEREKIEWAIGSIINGDSKYIQKFIVLYGPAGTGKSTVLNIVQDLFDGYYAVFDAKALGSSSNSFALESFRTNPLVAIQHDGDLSYIEDNTRLNSLIAHEEMTVNEKFKSTYTAHFNSFLFMGTNKPVHITDAKSGIIRRLIDVKPTGEKVTPASRYNNLISRIKFEKGGIAYHCLKVYESNPGMYDDYIPFSMMSATNDIYNFVLENYYDFKNSDSITIKQAYERYLRYCDDSGVSMPKNKRIFKEEMKVYFKDYKEQIQLEEGHVRGYLAGFRTDKFQLEPSVKVENLITSMKFDSEVSILDQELKDCPAQYAGGLKDIPVSKWADVTTTLKDIDTTRTHYVKPPENLIVIDFDIKDSNGEKSFELNEKAASKWPPTYAELSKSGQGIHLHYYYSGDLSKLSNLYDTDIEIKIFRGNSSLRRRLSKCNNLPIVTISSGLPLKEESKMVNFNGVVNEKTIRSRIAKNLRKEIHPSTKPSVDFIFKILEDAYSSGVAYDVTDMRPDILAFAAQSTNNADYCIKLVNKMHFHSEEASQDIESEEPIVFFDVEVFPNLFVIVYKLEDGPPVKMINPTSTDVERLLKYRLVGFNCRRYDNHILYARLIGYDNQQLYMLSQRIINNSPNAFFREAYNISYTDIYDFSSKKQSLKKFEIELGLHHQECPLRWDEPVNERDFEMVADYCINDVIATQATWDARKGDFTARKILAALANGSVNDTTNSLTTKIIFGNERHPELIYTELDQPQPTMDPETYDFLKNSDCTRPMIEYDWDKDRSLTKHTLVPYFPGYSFDNGKNMYRGEDVGKGGYVYAKPGMYTHVALLDVASLHPHSIIAMNCFGKYTQRFKDIMDARIYIKHKEFDKARKMLNGALAPYLDHEEIADDLSKALKIAINSVYGLTAATFENPFRDPRNINNIVALRGALFMVNLKWEVQERGYEVVHIKTDSIKIANADNDIIKFCMDYANRYGYQFEHEATYDRICLVNDAVYIARYEDGPHAGEWTATGAQFQIPYVFKTMFSKEPIEFKDYCETKEVKTALYLDKNEDLPDGEHCYEFIGKVGLFCPVLPGTGGGDLLRQSGEDKYAFATGCKGYKWRESEQINRLGLENTIDISYYRKLVDDAIEAINKYGDYEWFANSDGPIPYDDPPFD